VLVRASDADWRGGILTAATVVVVTRTRINPMWLILIGAALGILHVV
jgi:hypothetical protein